MLTFKTEPQHRCSCPLTRVRKFFQIHSAQRFFLIAYDCMNNGRTGTDNRHGAFDSNASHLQPFTRFASLLNFARIFMPVTHTFFHSKVGKNKLHPFSKISASVLSLVDFKMSLHSQLLNLFIKDILVGVDVSCSGFMEAGSRRSLGPRPMGNSIGVLPLKGYLCVSHRCCLAHQLGKSDLCQSCLVQFFGGCINKCQEELLEQSNTHLSSVWPGSARSFGKSVHIVHSIECLHVKRLVEGHIRTNHLRMHLEGVHPLMKLRDDFRRRGPLAWICCEM